MLYIRVLLCCCIILVHQNGRYANPKTLLLLLYVLGEFLTNVYNVAIFSTGSCLASRCTWKIGPGESAIHTPDSR